MKQHLNWIDVSRGMAFLMVIYSHLKYCEPGLMKYFSPIFLTTFFFVSGYLFKEGCRFSQVFEQRTRTLLWPFLILGGSMISINQVVTFNEPIPLVERVKGLLYQNGEHQLLWFIAAIYVYSLVFYWIERWTGEIRRLVIMGILLFVVNVAYSIWWMGPSLPWHVTNAGFGCFYMAMGKAYKHYEVRIDRWMTGRMIMLCTVVYIGVMSIIDHSFSFDGSRWGIDSMSITMLGVFVVVYISKKTVLEHNRFLLFVGANTLFYFAFHGKVYSLLQVVMGKLLIMRGIVHTFTLDFTLGIVITLLDALILIPLAMLVNRYFPWILGKGFKLWK